MVGKYQSINIPTQLLRTVVAISQTGSFRKAGKLVNLSQPAISAQIKRLQSIAGSPVFEKSGGPVGVGQLIRKQA